MNIPTTDISDLVDIRFLFRIWLRWSWLVALFGIAGAYYGVQNARNFTPTYKATLVVMPDSGAIKASSAVLQVSSALGLGVGGSGSSGTFDRLKIMVGSVAFAEILQKRLGLMQDVFAGSWDSDTGGWMPPDPEVYYKAYQFRSWFDLWIPEWREPDLESLARFLKGTVNFKPKSGTQFVEVSVSNREPEMALSLLKTVYEAADEALRDQDTKESKERQRTVKRQLSKADLVDSRNALIGLLTGEARQAMMLESDLPYAARVIEPAFVSNRPTDLNVSRMVGMPAATGVLLGFVLVTMVGLFRKA